MEIGVTAQVAVLNANGIALASDSSVTIAGGGQSRSYQSADKIVPIQGVPLAVLHSGNAALFGVPWQLLVEMWSQNREPAQAASVEDYAREFVTWLGAQQALVTETAQDDFFRWTFRDCLLAVRAGIRRELETLDVEAAAGYVEDAGTGSSIDQVIDHFTTMVDQREVFNGLEAVHAQALCGRLATKLKEDLDWAFDDTQRTAHLDRQAMRLAEMLVRKAEPFSTDAVLAFAGYGHEDYFPSVYRLTISGALGGVVRVYDDSHQVIDTQNPVSITPLGLTDAIHAFLRGTSPQYRAAAHTVLDTLAQNLGADQDGGQDEAGLAAHGELDEEFDRIEWDQFLSPMLDIVATLPVTETLRLADSLVGLASLRQMIQGDSTVGGPIDLARVTKQGGFQWLRNKTSSTAGTFAR